MKYLLIILISLLPLAVKSQDTSIKMSTSTARKVAKDLVICDSTKAILEVTKEQLSLTEQKVVLKDSIISNHVNKGIMYETRIQNEQDKFKIQGLWVEDLRKENKKLKVKVLYTKISMGAIIGFLGYLFIK
jgi:CRISPR/Cas system CMR subunit Cmr4 (Cas7 group RAMP superfamily)